MNELLRCYAFSKAVQANVAQRLRAYHTILEHKRVYVHAQLNHECVHHVCGMEMSRRWAETSPPFPIPKHTPLAEARFIVGGHCQVEAHIGSPAGGRRLPVHDNSKGNA